MSTTNLRYWALLASLTVAAAILAPAQQPVRTAAQQYKNIQVFKDVPAAEFISSMRFLSASLGVECEFCHTAVRSEDTPGKIKARKMMTMMMDINKTNFGGAQVVTCNTCHNGNHIPVNAPQPTGQYSAEGPGVFYKPSAPLIGATDEPAYEAYKEYMKKEQEARASMPTAEQVLTKYVAALGGETAIRKVTSRVITSTVEMATNVRGAGPATFVQQTQYSKVPNLSAATQRGFAGSITAKGFDGTEAWTQAANGTVTTLTGTDLSRARRDADFYGPLNLQREYMRLETSGLEKIGTREAYVLIGTSATDHPEKLYFDTQNGLLLRKAIYNTTSLGNYFIHTDFEDYHDVSGVKVPFLVRILSVSPADTTIVRVEKVENNVAIEASKFAKPRRP
jgi:photosynthetic reaction center cytochrome c subunit